MIKDTQQRPINTILHQMDPTAGTHQDYEKMKYSASPSSFLPFS